jgi:hypothetical protein
MLFRAESGGREHLILRGDRRANKLGGSVARVVAERCRSCSRKAPEFWCVERCPEFWRSAATVEVKWRAAPNSGESGYEIDAQFDGPNSGESGYSGGEAAGGPNSGESGYCESGGPVLPVVGYLPEKSPARRFPQQQQAVSSLLRPRAAYKLETVGRVRETTLWRATGASGCAGPARAPGQRPRTVSRQADPEPAGRESRPPTFSRTSAFQKARLALRGGQG